MTDAETKKAVSARLSKIAGQVQAVDRSGAGVPIAAGVLSRFFGLLLSRVIAAAMSFSSVSVIVNANALRLRRAHV